MKTNFYAIFSGWISGFTIKRHSFNQRWAPLVYKDTSVSNLITLKATAQIKVMNVRTAYSWLLKQLFRNTNVGKPYRQGHRRSSGKKAEVFYNYFLLEGFWCLCLVPSAPESQGTWTELGQSPYPVPFPWPTGHHQMLTEPFPNTLMLKQTATKQKKPHAPPPF